MKAKYNIYVRVDLQEQFDVEPNKSGLVSELLAEHYKKIFQKQEDFATVGVRSAIKHSLEEDKLTSKVTPDKNDIAKLRRSISPERLQNGVCSVHGVPLDSRGKCLQKGCKYS